MHTAIKVLLAIFAIVFTLFIGLIIIILTTPSPTTGDINIDVDIDVGVDINVEAPYAPAQYSIPSAPSPTIVLDGRAINFTGQPPATLDSGHTLIPLRSMFEALGYTVFWDETARTSIISGNGNFITIPVDATTYNFNGNYLQMQTPPQVINGTTMVPISIFQNFGYYISWDAGNNTLAINSWQVDVDASLEVVMEVEVDVQVDVHVETPEPEVIAPPPPPGIEGDLVGGVWQRGSGQMREGLEFFSDGTGIFYGRAIRVGDWGPSTFTVPISWNVSDNRLNIDFEVPPGSASSWAVLDVEFLGANRASFAHAGSQSARLTTDTRPFERLNNFEER